MTNERKLYLIDKAIGNLERNDGDSYGFTPIDFMRKNGVKDVNGMCIFLDSVGAYLEELRQGILAEIETESAKKNGKSAVLSEIKKRSKETYNKWVDVKPQLAYADYDEESGKYYLCGNYWLIVSDNSDGMTMIPEKVKAEYFKPLDWKSYIPDISTTNKMQLPPIGKISAYLKQQKALHPKKPAMWDRIVFDGKLAVNGTYLESMMKITGATEMYYKTGKLFYMEGNGYQVVIMPVQIKDEDKPTDFENL